MNFQNILHSIKELHDIFYYFSLFCTYDDIMNISILNKEFNFSIKELRKSERFKKLIKSKLFKRTPKDIILNKHEANKINKLKEVTVIQNILELNLNDFIDIFCNQNGHNGDLIKYEDNLFILFDSKIFSMNYHGYYYIPKYIQNKLGLTIFQKQSLKNISAFVDIQLEDFDFDFCKYFKLETIIYIRVWNRKLKIFIWIYVWFLENKIYSDEIINNGKLKISSIIARHKIIKNQYPNSFFVENGDIRIFLSKFEKIEKHEWFLE